MKKIIKISREDLKNNNFTNVKHKSKSIKNSKKAKEDLAILLSKIAG